MAAEKVNKMNGLSSISALFFRQLIVTFAHILENTFIANESETKTHTLRSSEKMQPDVA